MNFRCFRVRAQAQGSAADLSRPWRAPDPHPILTDEFELREAAIECARLAEAHGPGGGPTGTEQPAAAGLAGERRGA